MALIVAIACITASLSVWEILELMRLAVIYITPWETKFSVPKMRQAIALAG
ncbi:hypothetical protein [Fischerella thermalis]|uniref:hypothetical protein n=1 Tax=Fischerella thermalis TaxID=372787 RepID=UPI0015E0EDB6|nr:hypothetical protein [Fischerella thermalis]